MGEIVNVKNSDIDLHQLAKILKEDGTNISLLRVGDNNLSDEEKLDKYKKTIAHLRRQNAEHVKHIARFQAEGIVVDDDGHIKIRKKTLLEEQVKSLTASNEVLREEKQKLIQDKRALRSEKESLEQQIQTLKTKATEREEVIKELNLEIQAWMEDGKFSNLDL